MEKIMDLKLEEKDKRCYGKWHGMFSRAYSENRHIKYPTYIECSVSPKWQRYSDFKTWYDINYIEGYQLDKDILVQGNKIYGPEYCCFVPSQINSLFTKRNAARGNCVLGVQDVQRKDCNHISYRAVISNHILKKSIQYDFRTEEEAYNCYVRMKLEYIKQVADHYKDRIAENVYIALLNYKYETYEFQKALLLPSEIKENIE